MKALACTFMAFATFALGAIVDAVSVRLPPPVASIADLSTADIVGFFAGPLTIVFLFCAVWFATVDVVEWWRSSGDRSRPEHEPWAIAWPAEQPLSLPEERALAQAERRVDRP